MLRLYVYTIIIKPSLSTRSFLVPSPSAEGEEASGAPEERKLHIKETETIQGRRRIGSSSLLLLASRYEVSVESVEHVESDERAVDLVP